MACLAGLVAVWQPAGCLVCVEQVSCHLLLPNDKVSVNHLDVAPRHAGAIFGLGNTFATLAGLVSTPLTGADSCQSLLVFSAQFSSSQLSLSMMKTFCWDFFMSSW